MTFMDHPRILANPDNPGPEVRRLLDLPVPFTPKRLLAIPDRLRHRGVMVALSHSDYLTAVGGTEKVQHDEQDAFAQRDVSYIQIYPADLRDGQPDFALADQPVRVNGDGVPLADCSLRELIVFFRICFQTGVLQPVALHIHHLLHFSLPGLEHFCADLPWPIIRLFLHDYYTICPQFNLLYNDTHFCGAPPPGSERCIGCGHATTREPHLRRISHLLAHPRFEFVVPSEAAASIWKRFYPDHTEKLRVVPHQTVDPAIPTKTHRVRSPDATGRPRLAYVGNDHPAKGGLVWRDIVTDPVVAQNYEFLHLGYLREPLPGVRHVPVSMHQDGPLAMVKALLEHEVDLALLWSIWPETYSFTVFEAFGAGVFVLTHQDSGNIAAQVRATGRGLVLNDQAGLLRLLQDHSRVTEIVEDHHARHAPIQLRYTDQLVRESVAALSDAPVAVSPPVTPRQILEQSPDWPSTLEALERMDIAFLHLHHLTSDVVSLSRELHDAKVAADLETRCLRGQLEHVTTDLARMTGHVHETDRKIIAMELIAPHHPIIPRLNNAMALMNDFLRERPRLLRVAGLFSTLLNRVMDLGARIVAWKQRRA